MNAPVKTLLFDFGGTLDADGVAWKERFHTLYRTEGLSLDGETFAPAFYAADYPLVGGLPSTTDLSGTVHALTANLESELARRVGGNGSGDRGRRVASVFLSEAAATFERNRPLLKVLSERYRLGIVSNFYGNLEAVCDSAGLCSFFEVLVDSHCVGAEKPDPAIFRAALDGLGATPEETMFIGDSLRRDREGARRMGMRLHLDCAAGRPVRAKWAAGGDRPARSHGVSAMTRASTFSAIRGGIIAAGEGSRLRADGYRVSKPMVPVGGRPLIDHALDRFRSAGIRHLTVVINEASDDCRQWLKGHAGDFDLDMIVRSTPSSYATFRLVADRLIDAPAVITTVDTIMPVDQFETFVALASRFPNDAVVLGVTGHVDDENPLWVTLDTSNGRIRHIGGSNGSHVTAGLYWLPAKRSVNPAKDFARLRDYLGALVAGGQPVYGIVLPCVFDIDRARDVAAAEGAVSGLQREKSEP